MPIYDFPLPIKPTSAMFLGRPEDGVERSNSLTWFNKSFQIVTDSTPRITIGGLTGNVGIGTTSPTDQLHLYDGTLKIEGDSSDPTLLFKKTSDNDTFGF